MLQEHLDLRAVREERIGDVVDTDHVGHPSAEPGHTRGPATVFGRQIRVTRIACRALGRTNLHPADGLLNLPEEEYSHGLRRLAAVESSLGSFDGAPRGDRAGTGQQAGKRQVEQLARRSAIDADGFYSGQQPSAGARGDPLVLFCDGKGVVMRHDALRGCHRRRGRQDPPEPDDPAVQGRETKPQTQGRSGTVFDATAALRTSADILPATDTERVQARPGR
jgi:hypothetical protein